MRKFFAIVILTFTSFSLPGLLFGQELDKAQLIELTSKIIDQEGNPVTHAIIFSEEGSFMARTRSDGTFTIKIGNRNPVLIEADGYATIILDNLYSTQPDEISLLKQAYQLGDNDDVHVPFGTMKKRHITGAVTVLNPGEILNYDANQNIYDAINGRVPGLINNQNVYGMGSALLVVDGIPRPVNSLNLEEVEQITVLKDPVSRLLYGSKADLPVILVTTKRGEAFKRRLNVRLESGMMKPVSYPNYLGAADYMSLYNEALANDGNFPMYDSLAIAHTQNNTNYVLYPDERYFNSNYLRDFKTYHNLITEASGGNDIAQYFVYMGWNSQNSLLSLGSEERNERINMRGNADYKINDYITMRADAVAIFDMRKNLKNGNFWQNASTFLPNQAPVLIPVTDSTLLENAALINDQYVLGGTSVYRNNIYGDQVMAGYRNTMNRILQINTGLDFDLNDVVPGLTASANLTFDVRNYYESRLLNSYAVYEPVVLTDINGADSLGFNKTGLDVEQGNESIINPDFYRRIGMFGTLKYNRIFQDHQINATAVAYRQQIQLNGEIQQIKDLHFGVLGNYSFKNRYIAQIGGVIAGSPRFPVENRFAFSPAVGIGWIVSEEDFLSSGNFFDFLKIRANWGLINTDQGVSDYYLYQTSFGQGSYFTYNNGVVQNRARFYQSVGNPDIGWVKRNELSVGFEALVLNRSLNLEGSYFNSRAYDELTIRSNYYPDMLGVVLPQENYNSHRNQGAEFGLTYHLNLSDFRFSAGANMVYSAPMVIQIDEPDYDWDYLKRTGKPTSAMFGWVAEGLFADQDDIDNHATQTFGAVQPGDIKYADLNDDGIIDDNDRQVIGQNAPKVQYAIHLNLRYKAFELFVMGTGQEGQSQYFNNSYYWIYGDRKYSEEVLGRWHEDMADPSSATYPRLSSTNNSNNFRNSTYWIEETNWFTLHRLQLTMNMPSKFASNSYIRDFQVYVRGSNLFTVSAVKDKLELNIGSEPQFRTFAVGLNASF
ncbi:MAG: SusC/RagA family TonB-linked outer membrane protein [Bacteroidales bacterium]